MKKKTRRGWTDIPGYESYYKIRPNGCVKSLDRVIVDSRGLKFKKKGKRMNLWVSGEGYFTLSLWKNHNIKYATLHRLLATVFIPNLYKKAQVNHKNGIKTDNRLSNLEWVTLEENLQHAHRNGLIKQRKGNDSNLAIPIIQCDKAGNEIRRFGSYREAAEYVGGTPACIGRAVRGNRHTMGGFIWKRA